jgi:hypothetical protein
MFSPLVYVQGAQGWWLRSTCFLIVAFDLQALLNGLLESQFGPTTGKMVQISNREGER